VKHLGPQHQTASGTPDGRTGGELLGRLSGRLLLVMATSQEAEDALDAIVPMFPDMDRETVRAVLENTGYHAESAVEVLLGMCGDGSSDSAPPLDWPPHSEQQIADDEALARQLQQQLAWEDQLQGDPAHIRNQPAYPGAGGAPLARPRANRAAGNADRNGEAAPDDQDSVGASVVGAVYDVGAATAGAAGSLISGTGAAISGLWSWATEEAPVREVAPASTGRPPMEMQPMRATPAAEDEQVVRRGDADRGESGSGGEVRRRTRRAPAAGSD